MSDDKKLEDKKQSAKKKTKSLTRSLSFKIMETEKETCISQLQETFFQHRVSGCYVLKNRTHPVLHGTI